ncbi:MAG: outer membrane lipoprotein LolB [Neisseria sp.]|nr:outer membrane lipoprotein LolB [Neisseria sp.]
MFYKTILLFTSSVALTACANLASNTPASAWQAEQEVRDFVSDGRLAVNADGKGSYANFDWSKSDKVQTIDINTPLGTTLGQLCQDEQGALAVNSDGEVIQARNADELSQRLLGFSLPIQHLGAWSQGFWVNDLPHQIAADGSLQQGEWTVKREINSENRVRSLELANSRLSVRLVFSDWQASGENEAKATQCEARTQS